MTRVDDAETFAESLLCLEIRFPELRRTPWSSKRNKYCSFSAEEYAPLLSLPRFVN